MKKLHEFYTAGGGTAYLIGNPAASAINAPKGQRLAAYKDATGNVIVDSQIGALAGAGGGGLLGGAAGALAGPLMLKKRSILKEGVKSVSGKGYSKAQKLAILKGGARGAGGILGGVAGLAGGALIGSAAGAIHGTFGKRAQEIRNRHLSADLKPALRELAARSEAITEFAAAAWVGPSGMNAKGQRPEDNWRRGAGIGLLVGGAPGAVLTQPLASTAAREGVIYRKRDAAKDSLRLGVGSAGGALAGGAAGMAAQHFIPKLRGRAGAYAPLVGQLAGMTAGLFGGYKWAKGANQDRINDAKIDRVKTKMASAYIANEIKKQRGE